MCVWCSEGLFHSACFNKRVHRSRNLDLAQNLAIREGVNEVFLHSHLAYNHYISVFYVTYYIIHTHPFNGPFSGTPQVSRYQKGKPIWILLKQETVSGSGISWAICKSAPRSRQITMPAPHHCFYRPDALPAAQPTASKHWRHCINLLKFQLGNVLTKNCTTMASVPQLTRMLTLICNICWKCTNRTTISWARISYDNLRIILR